MEHRRVVRRTFARAARARTTYALARQRRGVAGRLYAAGRIGICNERSRAFYGIVRMGNAEVAGQWQAFAGHGANDRFMPDSSWPRQSAALSSELRGSAVHDCGAGDAFARREIDSAASRLDDPD